MGGPRKPNLAVYGQSLADPGQWKRIGAAWTNENKKGVKSIRVVLDFMPNTNIITIWPEDRPAEETSDAEATQAPDAADRAGG